MRSLNNKLSTLRLLSSSSSFSSSSYNSLRLYFPVSLTLDQIAQFVSNSLVRSDKSAVLCSSFVFLYVPPPLSPPHHSPLFLILILYIFSFFFSFASFFSSLPFDLLFPNPIKKRNQACGKRNHFLIERLYPSQVCQREAMDGRDLIPLQYFSFKSPFPL